MPRGMRSPESESSINHHHHQDVHYAQRHALIFNLKVLCLKVPRHCASQRQEPVTTAYLVFGLGQPEAKPTVGPEGPRSDAEKMQITCRPTP